MFSIGNVRVHVRVALIVGVVTVTSGIFLARRCQPPLLPARRCQPPSDIQQGGKEKLGKGTRSTK